MKLSFALVAAAMAEKAIDANAYGLNQFVGQANTWTWNRAAGAPLQEDCANSWSLGSCPTAGETVEISSATTVRFQDYTGDTRFGEAGDLVIGRGAELIIENGDFMLGGERMTSAPTPAPTPAPTTAPTGHCAVSCEVDHGQFKGKKIWGYANFHSLGVYHGTNKNHKDYDQKYGKVNKGNRADRYYKDMNEHNDKDNCDYDGKKANRIVTTHHLHVVQEKASYSKHRCYNFQGKCVCECVDDASKYQMGTKQGAAAGHSGHRGELKNNNLDTVESLKAAGEYWNTGSLRKNWDQFAHKGRTAPGKNSIGEYNVKKGWTTEGTKGKNAATYTTKHSAPAYTCDTTKNFITGQRYSQIALTDGCRNGVCNANPKYGGANSPAKAIAYCKGQCNARTGCIGFFFQTHGNGHEICGFYTGRFTGAAQWHGHK